MSHEGIRFSSPEQKAREEARNQPLPRIATTPEKVRVLLKEGKGVEIDWADGHRSAWSFAWLRAACPCATCLEERKADGRKPGQAKVDLLPVFTAPPRPSGVHAVGRYAIGFDWLDGHRGGIYSWEYLRRLCQCRECNFSREAATGQPN